MFKRKKSLNPFIYSQRVLTVTTDVVTVSVCHGAGFVTAPRIVMMLRTRRDAVSETWIPSKQSVVSVTQMSGTYNPLAARGPVYTILISLFCLLFCRSLACSVDRSVGRSVDWLVCRSVSRFGRFVGRLVGVVRFVIQYCVNEESFLHGCGVIA